jgi:putative copper resistance protein D
MLLFGVPLFGLCALRRHERASFAGSRTGGLLAATGMLGVALSLLGMAAMARSMSGAEDYASMERHIYEMIMLHTNVGLAWLVRMAALVAAICAALWLKRWPTLWLSTIASSGAVALSSLAWAGHGAMDDGAKGYVHLLADILHLLAAAAWVGSLAIFVRMSAHARSVDSDQVQLLSRVLNGFASMGTVIVATLLITGAMNYWLINGAALQTLTSTLYGTLLSWKLLVFVLMLGMAAANRYLHSPRLNMARRNGGVPRAAAALQRSLTAEFAAATVILFLVAWLGTLSP